MTFFNNSWIVGGLCAAMIAGVQVQAQEAEVVTTPLPPAPTAAAKPALPPEAEALREGLRRAAADMDPVARKAILGFFEARDFAPFWTEDGRLEALSAALSGSDAQGLPPQRYAEAMAETGAGDAAAREIAAMRGYLAFAGDLSAGIVAPGKVDPEINRTPERMAPAAALARLDGGPVAEVLVSIEPATPEYRALIDEKARLEALMRTASWGAPVPDGPTLHEGESAPRVEALRARLARLGYPAAEPSEPDMGPAAFDAGLMRSIQRFQSDHGLLDDGVAGPRTLAAVNTTLETRLSQVLVNLERLRWMNRDLGDRYVAVNIPDYTVELIEGGASVYRTRSVVGQASDTRTPEFSDTLTYFVVNPTWHIPDSIAKRVYLPKLRRDPSVLTKNNMRLFTRSGMEIDPRLVDFRQIDAGRFPFRIKQNPSAANALGRVKFMFPNQFAIYLHDTPARELFGRDARAFSNGCVRLEDPLELAYLLLGDQVEDPQARFQAWLDAKAEKQVNLERPIPVHILYRTVFTDEGGTLRYRGDVYGRDAAVFRALAEAGVSLPGAQG